MAHTLPSARPEALAHVPARLHVAIASIALVLVSSARPSIQYLPVTQAASVADAEIAPLDYSLRTKIAQTRAIDPIADEWRDENRAEVVLAFFARLTGSEAVARVILDAATAERVPVSLAFALAYEESRFRTRAVHVNANGTVDRGLFQLNSAIHGDIDPEALFDFRLNAKRGIRYLRTCLDETGSTAAAVAAYNAGLGRVDARGVAPRSTVEYVGRVFEYREAIERLWSEHGILVARAGTREGMSD